MAEHARHAAWHTEPSFAVRLLSEAGSETDLASGLPDLATATDYALEWLGHEDPEREGSVQLAVVRVDGEDSRTVWGYPPAPQSTGQELVALFGFNPVTWQAQHLNRPAAPEPRRTLPTGRRAADAWMPPPTLVEAAPEPAVRALPPEPDEHDGEDGGRPALGRAVATALRASWDDLAARVLLIAAAFVLWAALALLEPAFVLLSLGLFGALALRLRRLAPFAADDELY